MTSILVHRLEVSGPRDLALDADVAHWLAEDVGMGQTELWLRHTRGLVGDMSGALRLLEDLFPGARWAVGVGSEPGGEAAHAVVVYSSATFVSSARHPANALIAATMRAFEAGVQTIPFAANDRGRAA